MKLKDLVCEEKDKLIAEDLLVEGEPEEQKPDEKQENEEKTETAGDMP